MENINKKTIAQIITDNENHPNQFGDLIWNGNEIVFEAYPDFGVAGIVDEMPDEFGKEICKRWNSYNTL